MSNLNTTQAFVDNPFNKNEGQSTDKITTYFSQSQLALALVIQKTKPKELSIIEYFQQLRKHTKFGKPTASNQLRYIDTVEFWKDQYCKIHSEKKALEHEIQHLEEFKLLSRYEKKNDSPEFNGFVNYAQKILSNTFRGDPFGFRPPKQTLEDSQELGPWGNQDDQDTPHKSDFLNLYSSVFRIRRYRNLLEKALINTGTNEQLDNLAKLTVQVLGVIDTILSNTYPSHQFLKTEKKNLLVSNLFQHSMNQIAITFLFCFDALNKICISTHSRGYSYEITYRMVELFRKSLELLHSSSCHQAKCESGEHQTLKEKQKKVIGTENMVNKNVTLCLTFILNNIDWKPNNQTHSNMLEAFLFLILKQTGRLVSEAVFLEHVATSDNPGNITKAEAFVKKDYTRFESRYIVQVLDAALGNEKKKQLIAEVLSAQNSQNGCSISSQLLIPKVGLISRVNSLLQSTLVQSAMGGSNMESLGMLAPPTEQLNPVFHEEEENYGSEWLLERVWEIVGWDLIT